MGAQHGRHTTMQVIRPVVGCQRVFDAVQSKLPLLDSIRVPAHRGANEARARKLGLVP